MNIYLFIIFHSIFTQEKAKAITTFGNIESVTLAMFYTYCILLSIFSITIKQEGKEKIIEEKWGKTKIGSVIFMFFYCQTHKQGKLQSQLMKSQSLRQFYTRSQYLDFIPSLFQTIFKQIGQILTFSPLNKHSLYFQHLILRCRGLLIDCLLSIIRVDVINLKFKSTAYMFSISDEGMEEGIDPPISASGIHRHQPESNNEKQQTQFTLHSQIHSQSSSQQITPAGCTRFCKLAFYRPYFNVNQNQVFTRVKQSMMFPPSQQFLGRAKLNPDFYGPFWIITTLVLLLGTVGNLSNYVLSIINWGKWDGYFFRLEYLRYALTFIYSYCLLIPASAFFYYKFGIGKMLIGFPEILCLYGYSLCCYLPAVIACIIPLQFIHWTALLYAFVNSSLFLYVNLKSQLEEKQVLAMSILVGIVQFVLSVVLKIYFLHLMSNQ